MQTFINLHNHTTFSLLDGMTNDEQIIEVIGGKQRAFAITDHGAIAAWRYESKLKKAGIKPILGIEAYMGKSRNHLTVLAKNLEGAKSISRLFNKRNRKGIKAFFNDGDLQYLTDCIILTGCPAGAISRNIDNVEYIDGIMEIYKDWAETNNGNVYVEITEGYDRELAAKQLEVAKRHKLKAVVTSDSHYAREEDKEFHRLMVAINTHQTLYKEKFTVDATHILMEEEVEFLDMIEMDVYDEIYNLIEDYSFTQVDDPNPECIPFYKLETMRQVKDIPEDIRVQFSERAQILVAQVIDFDMLRPRMAAFKREMELIEMKDYITYFMNIIYIVQLAGDRYRAYGRGSAAGSVLAFLTGITAIDPDRWGTDFDRFLNVNRSDLPDVDLDFINGNIEIARFNRTQTDFKAYKMTVPSNFAATSPKYIMAAIKGTPKPLQPSKPKFDAWVEQLKKVIKHTTTHACGTVITHADDDRLILCEHGSTTMYSMNEYTHPKYDYLSNVATVHNPRTWKERYECLDFTEGDHIMYQNIPCLLGTFQTVAPGYIKMARRIGVTDLNDLALLTALYRPLPLQYKFHEIYLDNLDGAEGGVIYEIKNAEERKAFLDATADTGHVIVYQEQILQGLKNLGFGKEAEDVRKAISKKNIKHIRELGGNLSEDTINVLEAATGYMFNRAHAVSYAATQLNHHRQCILNCEEDFAKAAVAGKLTPESVAKYKQRLKVLREIERSGDKVFLSRKQ